MQYTEESLLAYFYIVSTVAYTQGMTVICLILGDVFKINIQSFARTNSMTRVTAVYTNIGFSIVY